MLHHYAFLHMLFYVKYFYVACQPPVLPARGVYFSVPNVIHLKPKLDKATNADHDNTLYVYPVHAS